MTSVFNAGPVMPPSCNLASILPATGVLLRVTVTALESEMGVPVVLSHPQPPPTFLPSFDG